MSKMLVWEIQIAKEGKKKPFKKLHILAEFFLQAAHMAADEVYGGDEDDSMFDFSVDIIGINKVKEIEDLVNAHSMDHDEMDGYNVDQPYIAYNDPEFPQDMKIQITCTCGNKQNLGIFNFPFTKCHDCSRIILRKDIKDVGGIFIYEPSNNGKGN